MRSAGVEIEAIIFFKYRTLVCDVTFNRPVQDVDEFFAFVAQKNHIFLLSWPKGNQGYTYESLAYKHVRKHMEPIIATFEPKEKKNMVFLSHEGEEFIYVLHGAVEFYIDDTATVLEENDSLYFDSGRPHGYRAVGNRPCKVLAVIYSKGL